jgi:hypothetical protein
MSNQSGNACVPQSWRKELALAVAGVVILVLGMVAFYYYPYPSGQRPDLIGFVAFWLREMLIIGLALALIGFDPGLLSETDPPNLADWVGLR